jgi:hypothetical protein
MGNIIGYADDAVLISDSESNLHKLLYQFMLTCRKYYTKISVRKTRGVAVSEEPTRCKFEILGDTEKQIMEFEHFGTEITRSGVLRSEVQHRTHNDARISGWMPKWRNMEE